ncbi:MAG: hypothetical protein ACQEUZ_06365 [Pseudomonadota bacterium]
MTRLLLSHTAAAFGGAGMMICLVAFALGKGWIAAGAFMAASILWGLALSWATED